MTIDELVAEFGEEYIPLIVDAIKWLDENEGYWNLEKPLDRREYIKSLIDHGQWPDKTVNWQEDGF